MALFSELKRRNVLRMAVLYVAAAWLILQVVGVLIDLDAVPVSIGAITLKVLFIGFPIALAISWYFEITPEGLKLEKDVERAESITHLTGRRMDFIVIAILAAALVVFAIDKWWIVTDRPSLAVLPCHNLGENPETDAFVMGLHEDLLTNTAGIKGLRVISRTSVDQYRNTDKTIPEIAKELGVNHLLECGVQRVSTDQGDRVRVNAQLIQGKFDEHLWAESYDRTLTAENLFRVQEDIARAVAGTLRVQLTEEEEAKLEKVPTENLQAYEAYLRGRAGFHQTQDPEAARQAIEDLQQAVDLDPEFAVAYAELAQQIAIFVKFGIFPSVEEAEQKKLITRAGHAAETALEFDDSLAAAYVALGFLAEERALKKLAYKRAIDLDPNYDRAYVPYAYHLVRDGKIEEGIALAQKAISLCPKCADYYAWLGSFLGDAGRPEEAEVELQKAVELDPDLDDAHATLAELDFFHTGRLDDALIHWRQAYAYNTTNPWRTAIIAKVYADLGGREEALAFLTRAQELRPDGLGVWPMFLYMNLGDREMGLEAAREVLERPPGFGFENAVKFLDYQDVREGRVEDALARMRRYFPYVAVSGELKIDSTNHYLVAHYAWLLDRAGQAVRSRDLLEGCLDYLESKENPLGFEVEQRGRVLIMLGRYEEGLATLESARARFSPAPVERFRFDQPIYDSVRDTDRFQKLVAKIDGDAARQLARLREMERNGEMPPAPGVRDWAVVTADKSDP